MKFRFVTRFGIAAFDKTSSHYSFLITVFLAPCAKIFSIAGFTPSQKNRLKGAHEHGMRKHAKKEVWINNMYIHPHSLSNIFISWAIQYINNNIQCTQNAHTQWVCVVKWTVDLMCCYKSTFTANNDGIFFVKSSTKRTLNVNEVKSRDKKKQTEGEKKKTTAVIAATTHWRFTWQAYDFILFSAIWN